MKKSIIYSLVLLLPLLSCEKNDDISTKDYSSKNEIALPTDSASDLAFANNDLWVCDRKNKMLRKIR